MSCVPSARTERRIKNRSCNTASVCPAITPNPMLAAALLPNIAFNSAQNHYKSYIETAPVSTAAKLIYVNVCLVLILVDSFLVKRVGIINTFFTNISFEKRLTVWMINPFSQAFFVFPYYKFTSFCGFL
jgi:hypothetical protein